MMTSTLHYGVAALFLFFLLALTDPFMYWMPSMGEMLALTLATSLSAVWVGLVLRERGGDERDVLHRAHAGRAAHLSAVAMLTLALVVQGLAHAIDPWIPGTLAVVVIVKLVVGWYNETFR